jgi:Pex14 N-terminal domain
MSDSEPPRKDAKSAPQWQQQSPPGPAAASSSASRTELLEQASRFLEDDGIRDAPTSRKVAFLESKGLANDEIQKLLGVSRNNHSNTREQVASSSPSQAKVIILFNRAVLVVQ